MNFRTVSLSAAVLVALLPCAGAPRAMLAQESAGQAPCAALELNKSVARRVYEEGLSQGIFSVPYSVDFVGHGGAATFTHADGRAEAIGWRAAFPDLRVEVDLILAEGDLVSVRWTAHGTNTGVGNGISATGKRVKVSGSTTFRFVDGAIAEEWTAGDALGLLKQLGLLPQPVSGATTSQ